MESLEHLLESGFRPRRSFFVALGHDEEGHGVEGAQEMARILKQRNPKPLLFILDEGTFILQPGTFVGVQQSVALYVAVHAVVPVTDDELPDIRVTQGRRL